MDGWTKNSLKCTTSHSGKDTGKMELFGKGTVNRKGMGGKYQSIRWKDTFRFSIFWNLKILWWVFGVQKILLRFAYTESLFLQDGSSTTSVFCLTRWHDRLTQN